MPTPRPTMVAMVVATVGIDVTFPAIPMLSNVAASENTDVSSGSNAPNRPPSAKKSTTAAKSTPMNSLPSPPEPSRGPGECPAWKRPQASLRCGPGGSHDGADDARSEIPLADVKCDREPADAPVGRKRPSADRRHRHRGHVRRPPQGRRCRRKRTGVGGVVQPPVAGHDDHDPRRGGVPVRSRTSWQSVPGRLTSLYVGVPTTLALVTSAATTNSHAPITTNRC